MKELGRLAFKGVTDELEDPSDDEQCGCINPQGVKEKSGDENRDGHKYGGNAEGMAEAIDGMLMAGRVLRDPLVAGAVAEHGLA